MGGVYLNMEGPAFSTKAESLFYQSIGMSVIGMTNLTEAKLAREAEICYSTMALVTDFDCWHEMHEEVTVDLIIANMAKNVQNAKKILALAPSKIKENRDCQCASALSDSIVTSADVIPKKTKNKLKLIVGKYIK